MGSYAISKAPEGNLQEGARKRRLLWHPGLGVVNVVEAHSEARKAGKRDRFPVGPVGPCGPVHADEKALIMAMTRPPIPRPAASAHDDGSAEVHRRPLFLSSFPNFWGRSMFLFLIRRHSLSLMQAPVCGPLMRSRRVDQVQDVATQVLRRTLEWECERG